MTISESPPAPRRRPVAIEVLTNRHRFGLYFLGAALSNFGNWSQTLAGILLVFQLSGSTLLVGLASVAQFVWPILLGPWAGAAADRFDRRTVLVVTQSIAAVVSGVLAALTITGHATVGLALAAIGLLGVLQAFSAPAQLSLVPLLVEPDQREIGLSLSSSQFNLARAIGPIIASGLILLGGLGAPFLFNSASFIAWVVLLRFLKPTPQEMPESPPKLGHTFSLVLRSPVLLPLLILGFVISGSTDAVNTLGPALSVALSGTDQWTGWFITSFGLGALFGAFYLSPILRRFPRRLPWTMALQFLGAAIFAVAPAPWVALVGTALFGLGFILTSNRVLALMQSIVPPETIGRVTAVWLMAYLGGRSVYSLSGGAITDAAGVHVAAVVVACTIALGVVGAILIDRREQRELLGAPSPTASAGSFD